jgi:hypothetical protein
MVCPGPGSKLAAAVVVVATAVGMAVEAGLAGDMVIVISALRRHFEEVER